MKFSFVKTYLLLFLVISSRCIEVHEKTTILSSLLLNKVEKMQKMKPPNKKNQVVPITPSKGKETTASNTKNKNQNKVVPVVETPQNKNNDVSSHDYETGTTTVIAETKSPARPSDINDPLVNNWVTLDEDLQKLKPQTEPDY